MHLIKEAIRAQAVAEAMGEAFEFRKRIKEHDVTDHIFSNTELFITDDTQMTLFGMEAQRELFLGGAGLGLDKEIHLKHLVEWRNTQTNWTKEGTNKTWLGRMPQMFYCMAPGGTCMSALAAMRDGKPIVNKSNGCGTVMKALPFALGLFAGQEPQTQYRVAIEVSMATHQSPETAVAMRQYMDVATSLMSNGYSPILADTASRGTHIDQWGGGWNATDCLLMAMWAVGNAKTFEEMMLLSIAHDGDSDSVAAVSGALWALAGLPLGRCHQIFESRLHEAKLVDQVAQRLEAALGSYLES